MISTLLKRELKSGYKLLIIFVGVLSIYCGMIVAMFDPKLGESLKVMAESMPQIFSMFGMLNVGSTLIEFLANYLYGFLLIAFPMVYVILLSSRLMSKYIDRGSMAYLLASPHKRVNVAASEAVSMVSFLFAMALYVTGFTIIFGEIAFKGELDIASFLLLNVCWLALLIFLSGICFCSACIFNESKTGLGVGGGICVAFVLMQMVSQAGDKFEAIKYLNPLSLFNPDKIISGDDIAVWLCAILFVCGIALYTIGITVFSKKDLNI